MRKALALVLALSLFGCGADGPLDPVVAVSPSPSPTPDPKTDPNSCTQADARLVFYNGAGNSDQQFDYREPIDARVTAINQFGVQLSDKCGLPRVAGWSIAGPCLQVGDLTNPNTLFLCNDPGFLDVVVSYGGYKAVGRVKLLR